jgi:caffeoyl-CoA O-methyltransferase
MASTAAEAEQQANGSGEQKTRHSEVGHKSLLKSDDLYQVQYGVFGLWILASL